MRFLDTSRVRTHLDTRVLAGDGTELSVDLYLPPYPAEATYPVLLTRTAADNNRPGRLGISQPPSERWKAFAAQGYIVAAADVRGRGDSDGQFTPFIHEASDGAATLTWLRTLLESNGKIGVFGSGYGAFCAWSAAVADGKVNAVASISAFGEVGTGLVHRGGAVRLDWLFWMHLIAGRTVQSPNVPPWKSILQHWPLCTLDDALGRCDIWWRDWLAHLDFESSCWEGLQLAKPLTELKIPGLHITGWWDGQVMGTLYYYEAACRSGAPQRLIVGPWDTASVRRPLSQIGGFDFGPRSLMDLDETLAEFFSAHLHLTRASNQSSSTDADRHAIDIKTPGNRTSLFFTGRNEWMSDLHWSSTPTKITALKLSSISGANTRAGDGTLTPEGSMHAGADCISHNPGVPVPFQPQFVSFATGANPLPFTLSQSHITERDEALVYTSAVLETTVTVLGIPRAILTLCTMADDADIFVLLSDSFPLGGRDLHLSHSAIRLATLPSFRPGEAVTVELSLDPVAHDFLPGHQIRLTVTPSLYPLYARNPHTRDYIREREPRLAEIEVRHGAHRISSLLLPVMSSSQE